MIIYLIGFMGTGKSAVSKALAQKRPGYTEYDMDSLIESEEGMPISRIFEARGEEYFRDAETRVLTELSLKDNAIISCGGGTVLRSQNRDIIKNSGRAILLTAKPDTILDRLQNDTTRPLLNNKHDLASITTLLESRRSAYSDAADTIIATDGKDPSTIASEVLAAL